MLESYLISVVIKSSVLLVAGLLCLRLLRSADAALRHSICLVSLVSAAAVPLLALWSPQWSVLVSVAAAPQTGLPTASVQSALWNLPLVIAIVWALGFVALMARSVGGWVAIVRVRRRSVEFQSADVRIAEVSAPLACGVLRPWILLPEIAREWDEARLRVVFLHESAHVERRDCLAKYVAQGARSLLWWNPLAWMIAARLNHEQELACDDAVLAAGVPADDYAKVLLDVARECSGPLALGCAMSASSTLHQRFTHLFARRHEAGRAMRRSAIAMPLLLLSMTAISFAQRIYNIGPGIVPPKILKKAEPKYTEKARAANIEGVVKLTLVVGTDQRAHNIKVVQSLDRGLDASAVASIRNWLFEPATKDGKPVAVRAHIDVNFHRL